MAEQSCLPRCRQPAQPLRALQRCTHNVSSGAPGMAGSAQHQHSHPLLQAWQAVRFEAPLTWARLGSWPPVFKGRNCPSAPSAASMPSCPQHSASNLIATAPMPKHRAGTLSVASCTCQPTAASCHRQVVHVCPPPTVVDLLLQTAPGRLCIAARHLPRQSSL